jgi:hypothetical protein
MSRLDKIMFRILGKNFQFPPEGSKPSKIAKKTLKLFSYFAIVTLLILGSIGLVSSYLNPFSLLLPYVDNCYSYVGISACGVETSLLQLESIAFTLQTFMLYSLVASIAMIVVALMQPESRRIYFSLPRKTIQFYKAMVGTRDWIITKVDKLNAESGKWKRVFQIMRSPYSLLRAMGFSPNMAVSFLAIGGVASTTVAVDQTVFADKNFFNGDAGVYQAPRDVPLALTTKNLPEDIEKVLKTEQNTLAITLNAVPVREIKIENVSVGAIYKGSAGSDAGNSSAIPVTCDATNPAKTGNALCPAILVSGIPAVAASGDTPAVVATRIRIAEMTLSSSRCKEIVFEDVDAHSIDISYNHADGISLYQQAGTAPRRSPMGGHHQAENLTTSGGTYDRLLIIANSSGVNGEIGKLDLTNIYSKGGVCLFKNLDIGTLNILQNEAGDDNNLATKEFLIKNTVLGSNWNVVDNIEINMIEPTIEIANP